MLNKYSVLGESLITCWYLVFEYEWNAWLFGNYNMSAIKFITMLLPLLFFKFYLK
jgi:hypothetical protein